MNTLTPWADLPESLVAAIYGETGSVSYNFGVRRQAKGDGEPDDEFGVIAGATTVVGGDLEIKVLGEAAYFPNFNGNPDGAFFATMGVEAPVGPMTFSAVYALREIQNTPTDHLATVSAEIEVSERLAASIGYRYGREGGDDNHTIGGLLVYEFGF